MIAISVVGTMVAVRIVWSMIAVRVIRTMIAVVTAVPTVVCAPIHSRWTPATLNGVRGRPIRAWAVSRDNRTSFVGDQCTETGAAHKSAALMIMPSVLSFFMIFFHQFDDAH